MSDRPAALVQIDLLANAGDLFRASLDLAKARLLLGLGFSITLVAGLIIIFLIIDEKVILVQTSPLFIGLPLVAVGGQLLRMHATCRKYVSSLSPSQRRMRYLFYEDADAYDVASGDSVGHISWNDVFKVVERQKYFLIFLNKFDVSLIPKKAIQPAEHAALLRKLLVAKLGVRAKLID